uniref:Uncharacterized protein n=1 Tax=Aureoumbra lagunensis TaxID=44058 RepID=A0A7S3JQ96_9STRA
MELAQTQNKCTDILLNHSDAQAGRAALEALNVQYLHTIDSLELKFEFENKECQKISQQLTQKKEQELRLLSSLRQVKREHTTYKEELDLLKQTHQDEIEEAEAEAVACRRATISMNDYIYKQKLDAATAAAFAAGMATTQNDFPTISTQNFSVESISVDTHDLLSPQLENNIHTNSISVQTAPLQTYSTQNTSVDTHDLLLLPQFENNTHTSSISVQTTPLQTYSTESQCNILFKQVVSPPPPKAFIPPLTTQAVQTYFEETIKKDEAITVYPTMINVMCATDDEWIQKIKSENEAANAACTAAYSLLTNATNQELATVARRDRGRAQKIATLNSELQNILFVNEKLLRKVEEDIRTAQFEEQRASNGRSTKVSEIMASLIKQFEENDKALAEQKCVAQISQFQKICSKHQSKTKNDASFSKIQGEVSNQVVRTTVKFAQEEALTQARSLTAGIRLAQASSRDLDGSISDEAIAEREKLQYEIKQKQSLLIENPMLSQENNTLTEKDEDLSALPIEKQLQITKVLLQKAQEKNDLDDQRSKQIIHDLRCTINTTENKFNLERDKRLRDQVRRKYSTPNSVKSEISEEISALCALFTEDVRPSTSPSLAECDDMTILRNKIHSLKQNLLQNKSKQISPTKKIKSEAHDSTAHKLAPQEDFHYHNNFMLPHLKTEQSKSLNDHIEGCASRSRLTVLSRPPEFISNQIPLALQVHRRSALRKLAIMPLIIGKNQSSIRRTRSARVS